MISEKARDQAVERKKTKLTGEGGTNAEIAAAKKEVHAVLLTFRNPEVLI